MNTATLNPIVELRRFIAGALNAVRRMRDVDPELMFDGAKQIADEIAAERIDRECRLKEQIARAQAADSPGGKNITATEALPIIAEANGTINLLAPEAQPVAKVA